MRFPSEESYIFEGTTGVENSIIFRMIVININCDIKCNLF